MKKKAYSKPSIEVLDLLPVAVMALSSGNPGLSGEEDSEPAGAPARPAKTCAAFWHESDWYSNPK